MKTSMSNIQRILVLSLFISSGKLPVMQARGAETSQASADIKNTYALIVSGMNKDPNDRLAKDRIVTNLRKFFLSDARLRPEHVSILVADNHVTPSAVEGSAVREGARTSTVDNLSQTLATFAAKIQPADRFVFYYTGQANTVAGKLRLNLPGQDITHQGLAECINQIKASSMMIVLDCPGAGLAAKAITGKGRIVVCGCEAQQHYSTKFGEYFVPALADPNSDTDGNGKVSVLEAFTLACKQSEDWYRQRNLLKTETPVLEDNADGVPSPQPWRYESDKADGLLASKLFLVSRITNGSARRTADGG
jgi:hypothetical protein